MKKQVNIGVVGVGHLGFHHATHLSKIKNANLVGIYDIDSKRSDEVSKQLSVPPFESLDLLIDRVDALSIVTPTSTHKTVAEKCIQNGKHVFIEKPITTTVSDADHIIQLAKSNNTIIQVGHIERFNPALLALSSLEIQPKYIEVHRMAPFMSRGTDVPVVLDLMIHDIDLVLSFIDSPVKDIYANGVSIMTSSVDIANARIKFNNGSIANITSSRVAKDRVRKIKIFQQDLYVTIDFLAGISEVYKAMDASEDDPDAIMSAPLVDSDGKNRQIFYEKPLVQKQDALKLELENYIQSVLGNETPIVDGVAGKQALGVAIKIHDKILEDLK
ncbi:MAG: Gfo/Idh/MocA family oxidoreductase [Candidatus Neomarinimicrobiota bacterium]|nr:Gfo/Idh/MocA family oxidoreductase [Candidatus Neomarinimicrobiota bacterium]